MGPRDNVAGIRERPALTREDLFFCLQLPSLFLCSWLLPQRWWAPVCYLLERVKAGVGVFSPRSVAAAARKALPELSCSGARTFAIRHAARRSQHHLEILRTYRPGGWRLPVYLQGEDRLRRALANDKGAVLWVAHFSSNSLAVKIALHSAGFRVWHVSRPEHGFSKSRFGIRWLNPIRIRAEERYLAGRIEIDRKYPGKAMLTARRKLASGHIVSITAGAWEGRSLAPARIFGGVLELAVGAPRLSILAGAPLLPVFAVHDDAGPGVRVQIGQALYAPAGTVGEAIVTALTQAFANETMPYIRDHPDQWRDWKNLRFG
jgi:lauroyl/myristoyl acyltransferase